MLKVTIVLKKKMTILCVLSHFSRVQLFVTPCTISFQALLSMGFSRQEYWSELLCPPPGDLPDPGIEPTSPSLRTDSLPLEPPGKPLIIAVFHKFLAKMISLIVSKVKGRAFLHVLFFSSWSLLFPVSEQ